MSNHNKKTAKACKKTKGYKQKPNPYSNFTALQELFASPVNPIDISFRDVYKEALAKALQEMSTEGVNNREAWKLLGDIVNLMQTFVIAEICEDSEALLNDATQIMFTVGKHFKLSGSMCFSVDQASIIGGVIEDFHTVVEQISHRLLISCYRTTRARIAGVKSGQGFEVVNL